MLFICKDKTTFLLFLVMVTLASSAQTAPEVSSGGFVPVGGVGHDVFQESREGTNQSPADAQPKLHERSSDGNGKAEALPRFGTTLVDGGNIELGLTLTAPFLNIPLSTGAHEYAGTNGHLVPGAYAPLKFDVGGLVLAGALAVGTIFLLPKFLPGSDPKPDDYFNDGSYPNHGRSDYEKLNNVNQTTSAFGNLINRLDETLLSKYHIDTTACAYRVICNAVQTAKDGVSNGNPTAVDSFVHILTRTPMIKTYFPPAWREIADSAWTTDDSKKQGEMCNDINMQKRCSVNSDIAKIVLGTLIPGSGNV